MAARSIWRATGKLAVVATTLAGGAAGASIITSDDPQATLKLYSAVPLRLVRDAITAADIAFDYEYSLWGLPEGSVERLGVKHEVHARSALKLQELCFRNGGIYIKLGQHIGQLEYLVPEEYVRIMRESMLNRCPVSSYDQVCEVVKKELGGTPDEDANHLALQLKPIIDLSCVSQFMHTPKKSLVDKGDYQRMVGLSHTRPGIAYAMSVLANLCVLQRNLILVLIRS